MHPDVTAGASGRCRKCDMALILGNPFDTAEYLLGFSASPAAVRPGVPFRITLSVSHPRTKTPVDAFEVVHDKPYHLFVISQDMSVFQHLHPERGADGTWTIDVTLPKAGYYRVISDFVPTGGSPQFLTRTLVTAGHRGDLLSEAAVLRADIDTPQTVDGITAAVTMEPARPLAGEYGHLQFTLTDARTGAPISDLQPYLGAFGHTLIMSGDMRDAVHSHPSPGPESDVTRGFGGPHVTFEGYLPRSGLYRAWTQFLRNDRLTTFAFTFRVQSLDEAAGLR